MPNLTRGAGRVSRSALEARHGVGPAKAPRRGWLLVAAAAVASLAGPVLMQAHPASAGSPRLILTVVGRGEHSVAHTIRVGHRPPTAYVTDNASFSDTPIITPIDTATETAGTPFGAGFYGPEQGVAITPDGATAYVTNEYYVSVFPVDTATNTAGTPVDLRYYPNYIAIAPDGSTAYVTDNEIGCVIPIDIATGAPGAVISLGKYSPLEGIAITPNGATAYVVNANGAVVPITLATNTPGTPITVGSRPWSISITPNGATAYVVNSGSDSVTPVDTATNTAGTPIPVGPAPDAIAITPNGATAYIVNSGNDTVTPIHTATNTAGTPIRRVGIYPVGIAISPNGATAYVTDDYGSAVTPIRTATNTVGRPIPVPGYPLAIAITPDQGPVAAFTATAAPAGDATTFDASRSIAQGAPIATYAWNFGDGTRTTTDVATISHTYSKAGAYRVTLTLTDADGTSTTQVFTGQTVSRNGGPQARATENVVVQQRRWGSGWT
jgi:YVTN family beta-propeller protein